MADLNAGLILEGQDTTHPTQLIPDGQLLQQAADTVATRQQTQNAGLQGQAMQLQIQQQQQAQQGAQQYAAALQNVTQRLRTGAPAPGTPAATDTSAPAPTAPGPVATPNGNVPFYLARPQDMQVSPSTPPAVGSASATGNPPGTQSVLPDGVDPSWKINKATDWYTDEDGSPISHYTGPALTPSGRINMHSAKIQDEVADQMIAQGANPAFVAQTRLAGEQKAQDLDKANVTLYQDLQKSAEAKKAAELSDQKIKKDVQDHVANMADFDLQQPNPQAAFMQSVAQNPGMYGEIMKAAVKPGDPPITQANDPRILPILKGLQMQSPVYMERQKADAAGVHIIPGTYDPNTGTTTQATAIKVGADGKGTVVYGGQPVQTPGAGGTSTAPGGGAPVKTPLQSEIDAVGTYSKPLSQVPTKMRPFVQSGLDQKYPEYDSNQFDAKHKALIDYTSGQDHKTVVAIQTAYNHLDQLKLAVSALNSGNTPAFNAVKQAYERQTGSELPTDAAAIKLVALDEVSKALTGASGGEGDREAAQHIVDLANAPNQVNGAIDRLRGLMQGKVGPLQDSATAAGLTPKQQQAIFGNLYQTPGASGRVSGNEGSNTPAAPKMPSKTGDIVTDSKGQVWAYKGSGDVKDQKNYILVK